MNRLKIWFKTYRVHAVVLRVLVYLPLGLAIRIGELAEEGLDWADEHLPDPRRKEK